jgi:serine/threonine protein kinase
MALALPPVEVSSPAEVVERMSAARLLPAERGWDLSAAFLAAHPEGTGTAFLSFLHEHGVLTEFQARRAAGGEWDRLTLGPFTLTDSLGAGTLGPLYRATHRDDGRAYAVQVLPLRNIWHVHLAKKLIRQFAEIPSHDGVVPLADLDTANGSHYLAWPAEDGEPLDRRLERGGPLPVGDAVRLAVAVAEALSFAQRHGIAHGCLSPSTILLLPDGRVRVLEWGVGTLLTENLADEESFLDTISSATAASQNLDYIPPETIAEPTVRTFAGDQYAFGCTLFAALTGQPPFPEGNFVDKMIAHQSREPERARSRNPRVPESVSAVVAKLLAKSPDERYSDWIEPLAILRAVSLELTSPPTGPAAAPAPAAPAGEPDREDTPTSGTAVAESLPDFLERMPDLLSARPPLSNRRRALSESEITFELGDAEEETDNSFGVNAGRPAAGSTGEISEVELKLAPTPAPSIRPIILKGRTSTPVIADDYEEPRSAGESPPAKGLAYTKFNLRIPAPVVLSEFTPGIDEGAAAVSAQPPKQRAGLWRWLKSKLFGSPIPEVLQISLFGPPRVAAGETLRLQAFAHPPVTFQSMRTLARAFVPDADLLASGYADRLIPRGTALTFHLAVANAGVGEPYVSFRWTGQPLPKTFDVHVPWESQTGVATAVLSVAVESDRTAVLSFRLSVLMRSTKVGSGILTPTN